MKNKPLSKTPYYGNLIELNTKRLILDSIDTETLNEITTNYLELLDTSTAIYETNGDYAMGIFSSGWCSILDQASRRLCGTDDNKEALESGKWLCHESCWTDVSKVCMEKREPVDIECNGGLRLYAVPIMAGDEIVGVIDIGHGNPPTDPEKVREIADKYGADFEELLKAAKEYVPRTPFEIEVAKKQLRTTAKLIGEIILRKNFEKKLIEKVETLERYNRLFEGRELDILRIKEELRQMKQRMDNKV